MCEAASFPGCLRGTQGRRLAFVRLRCTRGPRLHQLLQETSSSPVRFSPSSAVRGPLSFLSSTRVWGGSARKLPHGPRTGALARTACGSVVRLPPLAHRGQLPALIQAGPGLFLRDAPEAGLAYRQSSPLSVPCITTRLSRFKYKGRRLTL